MTVFKSYDIRGVYPSDIDETMAKKIGLSLGKHYSSFPENQGKAKLSIVVGRDMRQSAPSMAQALIDGLTDAGHDVIDLGMVTTPCCYFAIQHLGADGGVMCTASHNPPQYIGYKVSRELAIPISYDSGLNQVEAHLEEQAPDVPKGTSTSKDVDEDYINFLVGLGKNLRPIKVAADASNGMAGKYLARLFDKLPCELVGIYLDPDGTFPNHEADPLKVENLRDISKLVRESNSALGFCFDGDGDRVAVVDEKGEMIGCDLITALIAQDVLKEKPGHTVTYDLRSSKVVPEVVEQCGGKPVRIRVGHSHAKQTMRKLGAVCGGELSGHYYFQLQDKDTFYADSALVAVMRLLNIVSASDKPVSELVAPLRKYFHSGEVNFAIENKDAAIAKIRETFSDTEQDMTDGVTVSYPDWWFNVRPSNTEPLLRLTLEGSTLDLREQGMEKVTSILGEFGERASSSH